MIRRPPRSTLDRSSAASDVYKRQDAARARAPGGFLDPRHCGKRIREACGLFEAVGDERRSRRVNHPDRSARVDAVSYTHLRAHETVLDLVCRLLLEKKKPLTHETPSHTTQFV